MQEKKKREEAAASAEGLPKPSLTQPDAIQRGHSPALLQQHVLLGHGALGLPSDALHDAPGTAGEGWGAVPPLQGSLLIQELRRLAHGAPRSESRHRDSGSRARQGRAESGRGWDWGKSLLLLHALDEKLSRGALPAAAQVEGASFPPAVRQRGFTHRFQRLEESQILFAAPDRCSWVCQLVLPANGWIRASLAPPFLFGAELLRAVPTAHGA